MLQILRVGVTVIRYVRSDHAKPWLIHTYKNQKFKEQPCTEANEDISADKSMKDQQSQPEPESSQRDDAITMVTSTRNYDSLYPDGSQQSTDTCKEPEDPVQSLSEGKPRHGGEIKDTRDKSIVIFSEQSALQSIEETAAGERPSDGPPEDAVGKAPIKSSLCVDAENSERYGDREEVLHIGDSTIWLRRRRRPEVNANQGKDDQLPNKISLTLEEVPVEEESQEPKNLPGEGHAEKRSEVEVEDTCSVFVEEVAEEVVLGDTEQSSQTQEIEGSDIPEVQADPNIEYTAAAESQLSVGDDPSFGNTCTEVENDSINTEIVGSNDMGGNVSVHDVVGPTDNITQVASDPHVPDVPGPSRPPPIVMPLGESFTLMDIKNILVPPGGRTQLPVASQQLGRGQYQTGIATALRPPATALRPPGAVSLLPNIPHMSSGSGVRVRLPRPLAASTGSTRAGPQLRFPRPTVSLLTGAPAGSTSQVCFPTPLRLPVGNLQQVEMAGHVTPGAKSLGTTNITKSVSVTPVSTVAVTSLVSTSLIRTPLSYGQQSPVQAVAPNYNIQPLDLRTGKSSKATGLQVKYPVASSPVFAINPRPAPAPSLPHTPVWSFSPAKVRPLVHVETPKQQESSNVQASLGQSPLHSSFLDSSSQSYESGSQSPSTPGVQQVGLSPVVRPKTTLWSTTFELAKSSPVVSRICQTLLPLQTSATTRKIGFDEGEAQPTTPVMLTASQMSTPKLADTLATTPPRTGDIQSPTFTNRPQQLNLGDISVSPSTMVTSPGTMSVSSPSTPTMVGRVRRNSGRSLSQIVQDLHVAVIAEKSPVKIPQGSESQESAPLSPIPDDHPSIVNSPLLSPPASSSASSGLSVTTKTVTVTPIRPTSPSDKPPAKRSRKRSTPKEQRTITIQKPEAGTFGTTVVEIGKPKEVTPVRKRLPQVRKTSKTKESPVGVPLGISPIVTFPTPEMKVSTTTLSQSDLLGAASTDLIPTHHEGCHVTMAESSSSVPQRHADTHSSAGQSLGNVSQTQSQADIKLPSLQAMTQSPAVTPQCLPSGASHSGIRAQAMSKSNMKQIMKMVRGALGSHSGSNPVRIMLPPGFRLPTATQQKPKFSVVTPEKAYKMGIQAGLAYGQTRMPAPLRMPPGQGVFTPATAAVALVKQTAPATSPVARTVTTAAHTMQTKPALPLTRTVASTTHTQHSQAQVPVTRTATTVVSTSASVAALTTSTTLVSTTGAMTTSLTSAPSASTKVEKPSEDGTADLVQLDGPIDDKTKKPEESTSSTASGTCLSGLEIATSTESGAGPTSQDLGQQETVVSEAQLAVDPAIVSQYTEDIMLSELGKGECIMVPMETAASVAESSLLTSTETHAEDVTIMQVGQGDGVTVPKQAEASTETPSEVVAQSAPHGTRSDNCKAAKGKTLTKSKKDRRKAVPPQDSTQEGFFESQTKPKGGSNQKIRLVGRPWKTPEGTVNRPTLKMMLEAVMAFIMSKPGISRSDIYAKYNPVLQPVPVLELLELLMELGCVKQTIMQRDFKPSLFSSRSAYATVHKYTGQEFVAYNPTVDCILKLGQFEAQLVEESAKS